MKIVTALTHLVALPGNLLPSKLASRARMGSPATAPCSGQGFEGGVLIQTLPLIFYYFTFFSSLRDLPIPYLFRPLPGRRFISSISRLHLISFPTLACCPFYRHLPSPLSSFVAHGQKTDCRRVPSNSRGQRLSKGRLRGGGPCGLEQDGLLDRYKMNQQEALNQWVI